MSNQKKRVLVYRDITKNVLNHHKFKCDKYDRLWCYVENEGIWRIEGDIILDNILRKHGFLFKNEKKNHHINEIIKDVRGLIRTMEVPEEPPPYLIPFNNVIYNLKNDKTLNHSPQYFFINKLPVDYSAEVKDCPTIGKYFQRFVIPEHVTTLYELVGYSLYRDYPYQKLFMLYGSGSNGKSVFTNILTNLLGVENTSQVPVDELQHNKFAPGRLYGKFINIASEMDYKKLSKTSQLKQASGGDYLSCERKFKEPFPFKNYAKLIFNTNQLPRTDDKTDAFYRR
ncbi:phage/plasmid primase, P4 family [Candidatus Latescibacterota bacterium]